MKIPFVRMERNTGEFEIRNTGILELHGYEKEDSTLGYRRK